LQAQLKTAQAHAKAKVFNRACKATARQKLFLKNFQRFKKNKTPDTQARQKSTQQMIQTDDIKMVVTHDRQGTPAYNRRLAKKRVQCLNEALCFVSSSVLADSLVLRNPLLRQAPKRYQQC